MQVPDSTDPTVQFLPLQNVSIAEKREDHLSSVFRSFSIEQISTNKRPMSGKELLDALEQVNPNLHKQVKDKCSDYARIILSQSKSGIFKKYKKRNPTPGIDKRTLFYGLQTENYDPNEWMPFENAVKVRADTTDPLLKQISELKRNGDDNEASQILTPGGFNDIGNEVSFQEAKESWKYIIDNVPQDNLVLWNAILKAISFIDQEVLYGKANNEYVKDLISINSDILRDNSYSTQIEKVLTYESNYRHKLFQK